MKELVYKGGNISTYATSIAATWIWSPAIFVASSMAYFNGIFGFGWFLIPNVLTLVLFGLITQYFIKTKNCDTFTGITDVIKNNNQKILHSIVSFILLIASTCVQLVGLNILARIYFPDISILTSSICVLLFCYIYSKFGGIKACIISDKFKYFVILGIGLILLYIGFSNNIETITNIQWLGIKNPKFIDISISFGIITAIGLFCAPYVDNTFWQRVFSLNKEKIYKTFLLSAFYFMLIPLVFGIIGFLFTSSTIDQNWVITKAFGDNVYVKGLLFVSIFMALIATIDSNLCATEELISKNNSIISKYGMEILLISSCAIVSIFNPTIVGLFLVYGTIRTAMALPTIMMIYNCYSEKRLFVFSLLAVLIGFIGYASMSYLNLPYGYIFTLLAFILPVFGYDFTKKK